MEHGKQLITVLISLFIALSPLAECSFSYADNGGGGAGGDAWLAVNDEASMVAAFKAYCRSRNFNKTFTYSNGAPSNLAKAIINYDYNDIQKACALLGTDIDTVNAGLWYKMDNNGLLKFFYTTSAMRLLNTLYSALLTEHGIQENDNKLIYSGEWFEDLDGNGCYIYFINNYGSGYGIQKYGSIYKYSGKVLFLDTPSAINVNLTDSQKNLSYNVFKTNTLTDKKLYFNNDAQCYIYIEDRYNTFINGHTAIFKSTSNNRYYLGAYCKFTWSNGSSSDTYEHWSTGLTQIIQPTKADVNINANQGAFNTPPENKSLEVQTDSDTINNYITNNDSHDTYNYYNDDNPPLPPPYTNPYDDNPTGGTIDGNGNINFQMPDLNIDWNLDFGNNPPFPFSIPFDIINFLQAFNTEPVTPHIEETITIANMDIDIDIDLEWLDDVAGYFRTFILLSYIFGLIIATRALFHIY